MSLIEWNPNLSVNVSQIDAQHKNLIKIVNDLHAAMSAGKGSEKTKEILMNLVAYTKVHFSTEEDLMNKHSYPAFLTHKKEHDDLTKQVVDFQTQYSSGRANLSIELMNFLRNWLVNHIQGIDKKYSSFFNERGVK
jgi:hemerythrin-like metal-binding protein